MQVMESTRKAYKETYRIVENSTDEIKTKIPKNFIEFLKNYMDVEYEPNIDYSTPIIEQKLMEETLIIMAIIYRDYICSKEEHDKLVAEENKQLEKLEKIKKEKYDPNKIFSKRETDLGTSMTSSESVSTEITVISKKQNFIMRILNKVKALFFKA